MIEYVNELVETMSEMQFVYDEIGSEYGEFWFEDEEFGIDCEIEVRQV